jgi:predicted nuclease of predicted toxin-antitoxin system
MQRGGQKNGKSHCIQHESADRHEPFSALGYCNDSSGGRATHWSIVGKATAPDSEIMAYAKLHDYIVLTHDLDFSAILATTQGTKPSVIQLRAESTAPELTASRTIAAIRNLRTELASGALVTIEPERNRVSILPLSGTPPK